MNNEIIKNNWRNENRNNMNAVEIRDNKLNQLIIIENKEIT